MERIRTTHTGSLPRPPALMMALAPGAPPHGDDFPGMVQAAVTDIVARQRDHGVDIVNDGEMSKVGYSTYVTERMSGFGGTGTTPTVPDMADFPEWAKTTGLDQIESILATPACVGAVAYENRGPLEADLANLKAATEGAEPGSVFMSAASPGVVSLFLQNQHYDSQEDYLRALAAALKEEYDAIHAAGFVLQLDCPDLAMGRTIQYGDGSLEEWKTHTRMHVEVLNEATRDIPPEAMRMHLCWGNYEGPHHHDVPLADVLDVVFSARPAAISFEAANPRHEHEWKVFETVALPEGKTLIPGVVDSTTNYIEHPELVAQRLVNFASVVGSENVIAGTDCGFATFAVMTPVDPRVAFAKLQAMADGAAIASKRLWG